MLKMQRPSKTRRTSRAQRRSGQRANGSFQVCGWFQTRANRTGGSGMERHGIEVFQALRCRPTPRFSRRQMVWLYFVLLEPVALALGLMPLASAHLSIMLNLQHLPFLPKPDCYRVPAILHSLRSHFRPGMSGDGRPRVTAVGASGRRTKSRG
jgi:hypothetical protein